MDLDYLINPDFVVVGMGENMIDNGDIFVLKSDLAKGVLKDIAKANDVAFGVRDTANTIYLKIVTSFNNRGDIKMTDAAENLKDDSDNADETYNAVKEIVVDGFANGADDDTIMGEIYNAGLGLKITEIGRLFKKVIADEHLRITAKERKERAAAILEEMEFAPENYDAVVTARDRLVAEIEDTSENQALAAIRAYAKEHEIELPKKSKGGGGGGGKVMKSVDWLIANPEATREDFLKMVSEMVENDKQVTKYNMFYDIAQKFK